VVEISCSCGSEFSLSFIFPTFRGVLSFPFMLVLSQNPAYKRLWCVKNKLFAHPVLKYEINTHMTMGALAQWQDSRCRVGRAGFNPRLDILIKVFFVLTVVASIETQLNLSHLSYSHKKVILCITFISPNTERTQRR
jgi:hypothetical protein